jgi:hypothetical protein
MANRLWSAAWRSPEGFEMGLRRAVVQSRSPITGVVDGVDLLAWHWRVQLQMSRLLAADAGEFEALLNWLAGGVNTLELWHFNRPQPVGTMRGTPVLAATAAQFAGQLQVQAVAGATLMGGDLLGVGGYLVQVLQACTADASGLISVPLVARLPADVAVGTAVLWDRPTVKLRMQETQVNTTYGAGVAEFPSIELWEA